MKNTIRNSFLSITVDKTGAELISIKTNSGHEYMWEAKPEIWGRRAPILFPIVGKLKEDTYSFNGQNYSLNQHGFARDMMFELINKESENLSYQLLPTVETKKGYPFDFSLVVNFRLTDNIVEVEYQVENRGESMMPFSIGAHPAFALNWGNKDRIEDYFIEFEKLETVKTHHLDQNHLLSDETEQVLSNEKTIPLHENMFNRDALILLDLASEKVSLCSYKHTRRVIVEFSGFPFLGVWAKPKAPYVCIEPWHGYVDPAGTNGQLLNKPGIIKLEPGSFFSCVHRIIIED